MKKNGTTVRYVKKTTWLDNSNEKNCENLKKRRSVNDSWQKYWKSVAGVVSVVDKRAHTTPVVYQYTRGVRSVHHVPSIPLPKSQNCKLDNKGTTVKINRSIRFKDRVELKFFFVLSFKSDKKSWFHPARNKSTAGTITLTKYLIGQQFLSMSNQTCEI